MELKCKYCGKEIIDRKAGSIYCSPKCGWTYRNHQKKIKYSVRDSEMKKLLRSTKILEELDNRNKNKVSKQTLEILGFDFGLCTNPVSKELQTGNQYYRLLDYWVIIHPDLNQIGIKKLAK